MEENPIRAHGDPPEASASEPASPANLPAVADPPAAFEPVPLRYRRGGWTPGTQRAFIEALAESLSVASAAAAVGMSETSAYALRRRAGAGGFAALWDAVLRQGFRDRVRPLVLDKAVNGTIVRRYYHGTLVAEERVHSERLLLRLLDRGEKLFPSDGEGDAMLADWDGALSRLESGAFEGGFRVWRDRWGNWTTNFPPPPGFDNYAGEPSDPDFERPLTEAEEEALAAAQASRLETGLAARDSFFGFAPRGRAKDRRSRLKDR
jgi:hypothetical protein